MGGEKKPLGMSEPGCADGCGRRGCKEWLEICGEKKPLGMSELGCADSCGRRGCKGVAGNGWGEEAAGDERAWPRGRLRTAWLQWGEKGDQRAWLRGRLRTAADGVGQEGSGWKRVGKKAAVG